MLKEKTVGKTTPLPLPVEVVANRPEQPQYLERALDSRGRVAGGHAGADCGALRRGALHHVPQVVLAHDQVLLYPDTAARIPIDQPADLPLVPLRGVR